MSNACFETERSCSGVLVVGVVFSGEGRIAENITVPFKGTFKVHNFIMGLT